MNISELNAEQIKAAKTEDGPVLVLAGAGTGKTRLLCARVAYLIQTKKATTSQIMTLTFTNKAASEMKQRIKNMLQQNLDYMWSGTFHSICARIIRANHDVIGVKQNFSIADQFDVTKIIKQMNNKQKNSKPASHIYKQIQTWKNHALLPDEITDAQGKNHLNGETLKIYRALIDELEKLNVIDFGDLIMLVVKALTKNQSLRQKYKNRFRYILVDEYQDTNIAQYLLLKLLTGDDGNIFCVGDDDQSIYGWRDAKIENILNFKHDFKNPKVFRLEQNYRSTGHILDAANALIANNKNRYFKKLRSDKELGENISINQFYNQEDENEFILSQIRNMQKNSVASIAVLARSHRIIQTLEKHLTINGISCRMAGARFFDKKEIKDIIAWLNVLFLQKNNIAFLHIINLPKRNIGAKTIELINASAIKNSLSIEEAARNAVEDRKLRANTIKSLADLFALIDNLRQQITKNLTIGALIEKIITDSGYQQMIDKEQNCEIKWQNISELKNILKKVENIKDFLENIALLEQNDEPLNDNKIPLMTIHSAKGLEFDAVFLPAWEEEVFPTKSAINDGKIEEERRLAYVAITRARKKSLISYCQCRNYYGYNDYFSPSRFIQECKTQNTAFKKIHYQETTKTTKITKIGHKVSHPSFGIGIITDVKNHKLTVDFNGKTKVIMDSYVQFMP